VEAPFRKVITDVIGMSHWKIRNGSAPVGSFGNPALRRDQYDVMPEV
jgi:hypothetical protein